MLQSTGYAASRNTTPVAVRGILNRTGVASEYLDSDDLGLLSRGRCLIRKLDPGSALLDQGSQSENVYVLLEGWAFCYKVLEDGRRQILDLVLPGGILGFNVKEFAHYGVEAKTACKLAVFNRQSFNSTLLQSPKLCLKCASLFAHAETRALERLSRVGRLSAVERVSGLVVELAKRLHAVGETRTGALKLMLTQSEIADMLGLAKETVCRALMSLRKAGLINLKGGVLDIRDFDGLLEAAHDEDSESVYDECPTCPGAKLLELAA
jgi:CRP/FNR family transcriptional regulator, anaerobic regulatory protein